MKVGKARRAIGSCLLVVLVTGVLGASAPPALANSIALTTTTWAPNHSTGSVSYDLTLSGSCSSSWCYWKVQAYYLDGTNQILQGTVKSGGGPTGSFTTPISGTVSLGEVSHIKAFLSNSSAQPVAETPLLQVSDPYPDGSVSITVNDWSRDVDTGYVTYDFEVAVSGAKQADGPCNGGCYLYVHGVYGDGTTDTITRTFTNGTWWANYWTFNQHFASSVFTGEITHITARLEPSGAGSADRDTYTDGEQVSDPYSDGRVSITVAKWERATDSNHVTYDFTVGFVGAKQVGGPCDGGCYLYVEGLNADGTVGRTFSNGLWLPNYWSFSQRYSTSAFMDVTDLRARLEPTDSSRERYVGTSFVGDHIVSGEDIVSYEAALGAALVADPSTFCARLAVEGSGLPNTNGTSPPDAWEACESAIQLHGPAIRKVLQAVALATGGALALDLLLDEHANDGPVPTPEEEATPAPPWNPPDGWEDNGCYWQSIQYTAASEQHLKDEAHIYEYRRPGKSWFYPWVTPNLKSLAEIHALSVMPEPDPIDSTKCRRIVTYLSRDVGVDRNTKKSTHVYTVITWKGSGEVRTMFPGRPS